MHVPHDTAADKDVLHAAQMRVFELVEDGDVVQFDVEVLVDGFEGPADGDVVFELDGQHVVGERFEEGEEEHGEGERLSGGWGTLVGFVLSER